MQNEKTEGETFVSPSVRGYLISGKPLEIPAMKPELSGADVSLPAGAFVYFLMISLSFSAAVVTASLTTAAALFALAAAFSRAISLPK